MISDKFTTLNETVLKCLNETDESKIVQIFTEDSVKVLEADFGFVWLNSSESKSLELEYKSSNASFIPNAPRKSGRNYTAMKSFTPNYVTETKKTEDSQYVSQYVKSFVIIPLFYKKNVYGTLVLCFKKTETFSSEKRTISVFIGNSLAQAITIHRLVLVQKEKLEKEMMLKEIEALLSQEKIKNEFIANATHELRTPLAIIKGNIDLALQLKSFNKKLSKNFLKSMDYEVIHMSNIISDLTLLTTKGEKLKPKIILEELDIKPIVSTAVKRCSSLAFKKNISIKITKSGSHKVVGDSAYLEKMLINLIRNSIIYGKNMGKVLVGISNSKGSICISIKDDGIGISKEDLPHVFERFYRVDKSHSSNSEGTGLGLAIVKWIAEIHGGSVDVKSTEGKGSVFSVTLPIKAINN